MPPSSPINRKEFPKPKPYVSNPIPFDVTKLEKEFSRAELQFHRVDHSGASYEARIFLNNPLATQQTEKTDVNGYVGSFHVFAHGGCFGDVGHCEVRSEKRDYDKRAAHSLTPAFKRVVITEGLKKLAKNISQITVTIVPIIKAGTDMCDYENVLKFERISLVTYD